MDVLPLQASTVGFFFRRASNQRVLWVGRLGPTVTNEVLTLSQCVIDINVIAKIDCGQHMIMGTAKGNVLF